MLHRGIALLEIMKNGVLGSYTLQPREVTVPEDRYYVTSAKGSGPGGQAVNTSQNKAILRLTGCVDSAPLAGLSQETWESFLRENHQHITKQSEMIFMSHQHRSLHENIQECIRKIQRLVHEASFQEAPKAPVVPDFRRRERLKFKCKLKGSKNQRRIMKGLLY